MKKKANIILTAAFLVLIILMPLAGSVIRGAAGEKASEENRTLAAFPEVHSLADLDAFPDRFTAWFTDHLYWKPPLVGLKTDLELTLFSELDSDNVIAGTKKPWLFYRAKDGEPLETYKHTNLFSEEYLQRVTDNLKELAGELQELDIGFVLLIVPDKEQIYGDSYMPKRIRVLEGPNRTEQLLKYLSENAPEIRTVYPAGLLKEKAPEEDLYYTTDTHWNREGAYLAFGELLEALAEAEGLPAAQIPHSFMVTGAKSGDLQRLVQLGSSWDSVEKDAAEGFQLEVTDQLKDKNDEAVREAAVSTSQNALPVRVYLTGDSFRWNLTPFVEEGFSESVVTSRYYFDTEDLVMSEPDVLVYEIAERYLHELSSIPGYNTMALQLDDPQ